MTTLRLHPLQRGFTLVELMVTVAILGILGAIAYPSYTAYVFRSRIPVALEALSGYQIRMEQRFQDMGNYQGAAGACAIPVPAGLRNFTITCTLSNVAGTQYEARAVGDGPVSGVEYRINQNGRRWTPSHPKGSKTDCWTVKGGSCDT